MALNRLDIFEVLRNKINSDYSGVRQSTQQTLLNFITTRCDTIIAATLGNHLPLRLIEVETMKIVNQYEVAKVVTKDVHEAIVNNVGKLLNQEEEQMGIIGREFIENIAKESAKYAILSHRWGVHETTYQDLCQFSNITSAGVQDFIKQHDYYDSFQYSPEIIIPSLVKASANAEVPSNNRNLIDVLSELCDISNNGGFVNTWKLVRFCDLAHRVYGCKFAWIDTCCIDKTSSAELDESIRSMFKWYQNAHVCLIHLASTYETLGFDQDPWFTRGWTLQELLAPPVIKFHDQFWEPITAVLNDKDRNGPQFTFAVHVPEESDEVDDIRNTTSSTMTIMERVSHITDIPMNDLLEFKPSLDNIRNRLKWASKRETTRIEDQAYCLLGIFKINMPIAYGEGETAFHRLQTTIVQESNDRSLFLWEGMASEKSSILARSPTCFLSEHDAIDEDILANSTTSALDPTFNFTNYGLRIAALLYSKEFTDKWLLDSKIFDLSRKQDQALDFRLAVLAYQLRYPTNTPSVSLSSNPTPRRIPIVMLLIEERVLNYVRYRRHPWRPRAVDSPMLAEWPGNLEAIFIA